LWYLDLLLDNDRERESYFAMLAVIPCLIAGDPLGFPQCSTATAGTDRSSETRLYPVIVGLVAIADLHGRFDLLETALACIAKCAEPPATLVTLGD
jgi:hypothetical protein